MDCDQIQTPTVKSTSSVEGSTSTTEGSKSTGGALVPSTESLKSPNDGSDIPIENAADSEEKQMDEFPGANASYRVLEVMVILPKFITKHPRYYEHFDVQ